MRLFNAARLDDGEIEIVANHIDECEACLSILEQLKPSTLERGFQSVNLSDDELYDSASIDNSAIEIIANVPGGFTNVSDYKIGKSSYEIEKTILKDDFCTTYLARDLEGEQQYFLKIPHDDFVESSECRAQFLDDAKAAFALNHPNILNVVHYGVWDGRTPFLLYESVKTPTLGHWLNGEVHLDNLTMLAIFAQLADAIQYAHENLTFHRGIHPEQIFVGLDGETKVWNFGIRNDGRYQFELIQALASSNNFDSPEVKRNNPVYVDARSDVFSLGALLDWLLDRTSGFSAETDKKMRAIASKCTKGRRSSRFQTVNELIEELSKVLG